MTTHVLEEQPQLVMVRAPSRLVAYSQFMSG
jgi:hypothetical protein